MVDGFVGKLKKLQSFSMTKTLKHLQRVEMGRGKRRKKGGVG